MQRTMTRIGLVLGAVFGLAMAAQPADAFCGFYVSGAGADLYNNATVVVLMRHGTRTVLSMQNNYKGPPENFAMVVPVPVVLQEDNVKTLEKKVFERVDQLAAPRLVEYFERDPCYRPPEPVYESLGRAMPSAAMPEPESAPAGDLGVTIEAQFVVGEYEIVILSAKDSGGLDTWLRREQYKIPQGAEPLLRPYVTAGSKFFVAKVDTSKVAFKDGQAMLSPLRFHYDADDFVLPVRLGLINSGGEQDLLVHILAQARYEVANYDNVTIPTNLIVTKRTAATFGSFYNALFDAAVQGRKQAVVTEYSWDASTCDPCPTPALSWQELNILGADVIPGASGGWTLTRLHARYSKESLGEDLVFRIAEPIEGGRGTPNQSGQVRAGAFKTGTNQFQGRYIILHWWEGAINCSDPVRGVWQGPGERGKLQAATEIAFAPRDGAGLDSFVRQPVPEIGYTPPETIRHTAIPPRAKRGTGCGCDASDPLGASLLVAILAVFALAWRRRSRQQTPQR